MNLLLALLGMVLAFFVLRWLAKRYFLGPRRAEAVAAAVVVAFAIGSVWPYSERIGGSSGPTASGGAEPAATAAAPRLPNLERDVRSVCASASAASQPVAGNVDGAARTRGGQTQPQKGKVELSRGDAIALTGWATNASHTALAKATCLAVDGTIFRGAGTRYGAARPDVATAFQNSSIGNSGFVATIAAASLSRGTHRLNVAVVTESGGVGMLPQTVDVLVR